MKQKVIFADKTVEAPPIQHVQPMAQPQPPKQPPVQDQQIVLTRDDYRDIVKEAYNEGIEDAKEELGIKPQGNEEKEEKKQQGKEASNDASQKQASEESSSPASSEESSSQGFAVTKKSQKINKNQNMQYISQKSAKTPDSGSRFDKIKVGESTEEESTKKGKQSAMEVMAKDKEEAREHFKSIANRHDIQLMKAVTVFPFTFFTDTIIIDTVKLTIIHKKFFGTYDTTTIPLKDLADVGYQKLFFLGSLDIKYMPQANSGGTGMIQPIETRIANLPKSAAEKAKNILKGAMVAKAEGIDISKLSPKEVVNVVDEFGKDT